MTLKRKPKWENKWNIILGCIVGLVLLLHFLPIGLGFATEKLKLGDDTIENTGHSAAELEKEGESEDISDTGEIVIMKNILLDDENQKLDGLEGGEDEIELEEGEEGIINNEDGEKGENLAEIQEEDISFSKGGKSTQAVDTQSQGEEDSISDDIEIDRETKVQENAEEITETKGLETKTELGDESNGEIDTKGKEDTGETETQGKTEGLDGKTDDPKAPSIAILLPGGKFNLVLSDLTRGDLSQIVTITGSVNASACRVDTIISDPDSAFEVSARFSRGILTYCTTAPEIYLNADSDGMFAGLTNLTSIKLSDFNTSMVETMVSMFDSCSSLRSLDLRSFDTTNVTDMSYMFSRCSSLTSLDLSSFDTTNVTDMSYMFSKCPSLTSLDLSIFDTTNVTDMSYMFAGCSSLTSLDLRSFDISNLFYATNMFSACSELETIYVNNFVATDIKISNMFYGAENLVGGFGTMYDPNYVDGTLALPDSQTRSGYFTKDNVLVSFRDSDDHKLSSEVVEIGTRVGIPQMKTGYVATWYTDTGYTDLFDFTSRIMKYTKVYGVISCDTGYVILTGNICVNDLAIVLEATATGANKTLKINKYFANDYTVDRGDGTVENLTADTTHIYADTGIYYIVLSLSGASRWTFQNVVKALVPIDGTTMAGVKITHMPSLADGFGNSATNVGDHFFHAFNYHGAITSLPEGSFDTSNIITVGTYFFSSFNNDGNITALPEGSFDTSSITTVGNYFFYGLNVNGKIVNLPNSFTFNSVGYNAFSGYKHAFNSPNYTINKNASDLIFGVTVPLDDRDTFSANQPGICGIDPNWLVNTVVEDNSGNCVRQIMVTFVANPSAHPGGYFSGGVTTKTLEYRQAQEGYYYAVTGEIQVPNLDAVGDTGYMFEGWYTATGYTSAQRWIGLTTGTTYNSITLYARYLPFKDKTLTRDGVTFSIMDRNLGATAASSGYTYNTSNASTRGLYFQWGNNFGFANAGTLANRMSSVLITNYSNNPWGPGNYYFNGTFIIRSSNPTYWNSGAIVNDNLWGGNSASNPDTDRQGPCPEGYHVPYSTEWTATKNLFDKWKMTEDGTTYCNSLTNSASEFCLPAVLGMPFVGYRSYSTTAGTVNATYQKTRAFYQAANSSTTNINSTYRFYATSGTLTPAGTSNRTNGFVIRCFKNTSNLTLTFDSKGGSSVPTQSNFRRWQARSSNPTNPTRANSTFAGWYKDTGYTDEFVFSSTTYVSDDTTLYAKWECNTGYTDVGNACLDTTAPTCIWGQPSKTELKYGETGSITLTCTDEAGIVEAALFSRDITVSGDYLGISKINRLTSIDSVIFTIEYGVKTSVQGEVDLIVSSGIICDSAGNCNEETKMTDYIFQSNGTITVCDPNDSDSCITMMDRNLGAIEAGTGCSDVNKGVCGYHYQWGNNHGFQICYTNGCTDLPGGETMAPNSRISTSVYGPGNYYTDNLLRIITDGGNQDWSSPSNDNLWGGNGSEADRQGPCPDGFHVPTISEWGSLMQYWVENRVLLGDNLIFTGTAPFYSFTGQTLRFADDFKFPFGGNRGYSNGSMYNIGTQDSFWVSTPVSSGTEAYRVRINSNLDNSVVTSFYRSYPLSLRCFKDVPNTGFTAKSAIVVDSIVPEMVFTVNTPAHNAKISENNFTSQIEITESNLSGFKSSFDGVQTSLYDDSLILMYNFDNVSALGESSTVVKDLSNHGNNGTVNGATWTSNGRYGGAYSFDGSNDYVQLPNDLGYENNISVFAWFKSTGTPKGGYHIIFGGSPVEISIPTAGQIRAGLYINGSRYVDNYGSGLTDGKWHLVGMTYDGSAKKAYIDGKLVGTKNISGTLSVSFNRTIGRYGTDTTYNANGQIDEVRIYNRALSASEIQELYRGNLSKTDVDKWTYTVEYTGLTAGTHTYGGRASDEVGNESLIVRDINIDLSAPSVVISSNGSGMCAGSGDVYTVTGVFSEAVTGIDASTLSVTNGSVQDFQVVSGNVAVWTVKAGSSYMHYGNGTITICDPNDSTKCITMQDKNLGASEAGTGTSSYGYHFQWGNNHGFEIGCRTNGCSDTVTNSATSTLAVWSPDYNHVGYNGATFIKGTSSSKFDYWSDNTPSNHNGLRGGENDTAENNYGFDETDNVATNVANRRGPCGEGYHVPSIGERGILLKYWAANYTGAGNTLNLSYSSGLPKFRNNATAAGQFQEDFKIPFAGYREYYDAKVYDMGNGADLWSSSPFVGNDHARYVYLDSLGAAYANNVNPRAGAFSVRCFKDSYLEFPSSEGGDSTVTVSIETGAFTDLAGNANTTGSNTISRDYDESGPTGTIDVTYSGNNTYATDTTLTLALSASDEGCNGGVSGVQFSCDGVNRSAVQSFATNKTFTLEDNTSAGCTTGDGIKTIYARFIDGFGNPGEAVSDSIKLNRLGIVLQATATAANQTLKINKYFANAYTVDRGDGTTGNLTADTTHTYTTAGTYTITLSLSGADRWTFQNVSKPLVPKNGTAMTGVKIIYMPALAEGFGDSATAPGDYFFSSFNSHGAITSLPDGSFDTLNITVVGGDFFRTFNSNGAITSLPAGSFDTSNITVVGDKFFMAFNENGLLVSLPVGSFNTEHITTVGDYFFSHFNNSGALTSLPDDSFDISNIVTIGNRFFSTFNQNGALTSLPTGSFDISSISGIVRNQFFNWFNNGGALTSLPAGSFDTSNITAVGDEFFSYFNQRGVLTNLPDDSFNISNITTVGDEFFFSFNNKGALTSLPAGSFNTSNISGAVGYYFFDSFNFNGKITSLPENSFNISNVTSADSGFFYAFNAMGKITSFPEGSFDTSNLTSVGEEFFAYFNMMGSLTSLPAGSFNLSNITSTDDMFLYSFNYEGKITELPDSFTISSVGASVTGGYDYAFYSADYTINKGVYDLVSGVTVPLYDKDVFSDNQPKRCGVDPNWLVTTADACSITYDSNGGSTIANPTQLYTADTTGVVAGSGITTPTRANSQFVGWYTGIQTGNQVTTVSFPAMDSGTLYAFWSCDTGYKISGDQCVPSKDIILQATATAANQTLTINKYFANAYTVDRGDGTAGNLTADTTHTYNTAGTYTITLSLAGTATRWTFQNVSKPLVPKNGMAMTGVKIIYMPALADGFGNNATAPGDYFFYFFNYGGSLTSLPEGSFDTSNITTAGTDFFSYFNSKGSLTSLPGGSFDTSNITTAGNHFFNNFNDNGALTSLPGGSFRLSTGLTTAGTNFFSYFNYVGSLTSLPEGSFDTSNITTAGNYFFNNFNGNGSLTSLPGGSFDTSNITTAGTNFFSYFNYVGSLTSLPEGSFDTSNITKAGIYFFSDFNNNGALTSLPGGSFDTSNITTAGTNFFSYFNSKGSLTSLPGGSFDTSNITTAGNYFFNNFNDNGALTSLPGGSFRLSTGLTAAGNYFFYFFNYGGSLTSLPEGSFDTSNITTAGTNFFYSFNRNGALTSLPDSFKLTSAAYNKTNGYQNAFNSPNYTLNKNVSDLVSGVVAPNSDRNTFSDNQLGRCGVDPNWLVTTANACSITYDSNGGSTIANPTQLYTADTTSVVAGSGITTPTRANSQFVGWYTGIQTGNQVTTVLFPAMDSGTLYAFWSCDTGYKISGDACVLNKDIVLEATATAANQKLKINKYFANAYTVDRGDGTTGNLTADTTHTYTTAGTYTITLSLAGTATRWTFQNVSKPLIPKNGTAMTGVKIIYMPALADGFGDSATTPGDNFFRSFNNLGSLTSLPDGSFDTLNITTVGGDFFRTFNSNGAITTLPDGSFDMSNIIEVGDRFFSQFNYGGALTSLPTGSFNITNITSVGLSFFSQFNYDGALTSLPTGSFNTENIVVVGDNFFGSFNQGGSIISLPSGSFKLSTGLTSIGSNFFSQFNYGGALTSLPTGSFNTENIAIVGGDFFGSFNQNGAIISLPLGSFRLSTGLTIVSMNFFFAFNQNGAITSLPENSFKVGNITQAEEGFFSLFNYEGAITSLPNSFTISSTGASVALGYSNAFNSSYTINRNVSDLVSGVTAPLDDRDTFSDNQPKRCGVDSNWLVTTADACSITYDSNGGSTPITTNMYTADTTGVVAGSGVTTPTRVDYEFVGWYTGIQSGSQVTTVVFPAMDSGTLYAHWRETVPPTVVISSNGSGMCAGSGDVYTVTGVFSEAVTGIDASTLTVHGGTVQSFTMVSGDTAVWTVSAGGNGGRGRNSIVHDLGNGLIVTYYPEANVSYTLNGNENFTAGLITITDGTEMYTIMDRNLGATSTGVDSSDSYGYYFQWGNNYGFPNTGSVSVSNTRINASGYGPGNYYSGSTFIMAEKYSSDWSSVQNDNLWGWTSGTVEAMQGPCPEGYHVPSSEEFSNLLSLYNSSSSSVYMTTLFMPLAGFRGYGNSLINYQNQRMLYWTTTPYSPDRAYVYDSLLPGNTFGRSNGNSIRCFKNSPYSASDFSREGGDSTVTVSIETGAFTDLAGNTNTTGSNTITWDYDAQGPEVQFDDISVPECSDAVWTVTGTDAGCAGLSSSAYKFGSTFGDQTWGVSNILNINTGTVGQYTQEVTVRDSFGNETVASATLTVIDTAPTANDFTVDEVGAYSEANWIEESEATDGDCGVDTLEGEVIVDGIQGYCEIDEEDPAWLMYYPDDGASGSDSCTIMITDDEGSTGTFTVTWNDIYRPNPQVLFVLPTPASGSVLTTNKFTLKAEISDVENIDYLVYHVHNLETAYMSTHVINPSNYYIFNFDDVADLGEVENETVVSVGMDAIGTVYGATRVSSGRYGGAYSFDGFDDYIDLGKSLATRGYSIVLWAKPDGREWTHFVYVYDPRGSSSYYKNGIYYGSVMPLELNGVFASNSIIGKNKALRPTYFAGLIDEVRVYPSVISADEVQYLYNSNLRKTGIDTWEFETINSCLDMSGMYEYAVEVTSDIGTYGEDARTISTQISVSPNDFSVDGVGLGTDVNWIEEAGVSEFVCGDYTLEGEVIVDGTQGECSINKNSLEYYPYDGASGSDTCTILVTHSDGNTGEFTVTWNDIYRPNPQVTFVSPTPADGVVRDRNRFTTKAEISDVEYIDILYYGIYDVDDDFWSENSISPMMIYNFDNISDLGEVENKSVVSVGESEVSWIDRVWLVDGATRVNSGRYGGAYSFDGIDDSFDAQLIFQYGTPSPYSFDLWVKPDGEEWTHIVYVYDPDGGEKYYVNGREDSLSDELYNAFSLDVGGGRTTFVYLNLGYNDDQYFSGLIDEVRVFNYALTQEDVQFLYKSNLRKTGLDTWEFETITPCLDMSGSYEYYVGVDSNIGTYGEDYRTLTTQIPITVNGTGYDFGTHVTTGLDLILTGTMGTLTVTDYVGQPGWRLYFTTSPYLVGQDTQETISTENLMFKASGLVYSGLYGLEQSPYVHFMRRSIVTTYTSAASGTSMQDAENNPILEYFARDEIDESDWLCEDVGTYSDDTQIMLEVPAWQVEDVYTGTLWITLQIEGDESENEGGGKDAEETKDTDLGDHKEQEKQEPSTPELTGEIIKTGGENRK